MKIISKRERIETITYTRFFQREGVSEGSGAAFDCDANGNVDVDKLQPAGRKNYEDCLMGVSSHWEGVQYKHDPTADDGYGGYVPVPGTGHIVPDKMIDRGVQEYRHSYTQPAVGECACGEHVDLGHFTNTCECGRDYNMSGQLLAPRSQWGEETGESVEDILAIDVTDPEKCLE